MAYRPPKEKTRAELAQAGMAAAPKDGKRWYQDQYVATGVEWQEKLLHLHRAGQRNYLEHPHADPHMWMVTLIHRGGYVYMYYKTTTHLEHEYYTAEDIAGPDPAWTRPAWELAKEEPWIQDNT